MIITSTEDETQNESSDPTELLIKEARRKSRRRRSTISLVIAAVLIAAVLVVAFSGQNGRGSSSTEKPGSKTNASLATCSSGVLTLRSGFTQAAAGNGGTPIVITNHGSSSCSLSGFPAVVAHTEASSPRPVTFVHRPRSQIYRAVLPKSIVLSPKGTASFGLSYVDALDQQYGSGSRCQMNAITVSFPRVTPVRNFTVPLVANGHDGYGPINSCFAGFILGLTPIVKGPTPPEY